MPVRLTDLSPGSTVDDEVIEHDAHEQIRFQDLAFDGCTFLNLDLASIVITRSKFVDCSFRNCNLSNVEWPECSIRNTTFESSKLTGSIFSVAEWSSFSAASPNRFVECDLSYVNFASAELGSVLFTRCRLREATFGGTDLVGATFDDCDLAGTDFLRANIERCDFTTAYNFSIDPRLVRVRGARFSQHRLAGLVQSFGIEIE